MCPQWLWKIHNIITIKTTCSKIYTIAHTNMYMKWEVMKSLFAVFNFNILFRTSKFNMHMFAWLQLMSIKIETYFTRDDVCFSSTDGSPPKNKYINCISTHFSIFFFFSKMKIISSIWFVCYFLMWCVWETTNMPPFALFVASECYRTSIQLMCWLWDNDEIYVL